MNSTRAINLRDVTIVIADQNPFQSTLTQAILRGFGANKMLAIRHSSGVLQTLATRKIDILLCDAKLPPDGGFWLTRALRRNAGSENRTIPILITASDTREATIKIARDVGANMVIAKPMSPATLYDRLNWIAFHPRQFVETETYFGPDRRFKIEGYPQGQGRRSSDKPVKLGDEAGPALAQDDIDSLFSAAQTGQS